MKYLYIEDINPEPWQASEGSVGRKNGKFFVLFHKPSRLAIYQASIRETVQEAYPDAAASVLAEPVEVRFYFWRRLERYKVRGRNAQRKPADATNLQKALEDALQGILFANDRQVRRVFSEIVDQGEHVKPLIIVAVEPYRSDPRSLDILARTLSGERRPSPPGNVLLKEST